MADEPSTPGHCLPPGGDAARTAYAALGRAGEVHARLIDLIVERIALERSYALANRCPYLPRVETPADHEALVDALNDNNAAILAECVRLGEGWLR